MKDQTSDMSTSSLYSRFFLKTTYFLYKENFYQQNQGAAIGSPVSPIVANKFMESFENRVMASPLDKIHHGRRGEQPTSNVGHSPTQTSSSTNKIYNIQKNHNYKLIL